MCYEIKISKIFERVGKKNIKIFFLFFGWIYLIKHGNIISFLLKPANPALDCSNHFLPIVSPGV